MFGWTSLATLDLADRLGGDTDTLREILLGQVELAAVLADTLAEDHIILHWAILTWPSGHVCTGLCPLHCTHLPFFCGRSCDVIATVTYDTSTITKETAAMITSPNQQ